jgi:hypothetical protein
VINQCKECDSLGLQNALELPYGFVHRMIGGFVDYSVVCHKRVPRVLMSEFVRLFLFVKRWLLEICLSSKTLFDVGDRARVQLIGMDVKLGFIDSG